MSPALGELVRWERAGGTWRVEAIGDEATVVLLTCTGAEEMARITSSARDFRDYVSAGPVRLDP